MGWTVTRHGAGVVGFAVSVVLAVAGCSTSAAPTAGPAEGSAGPRSGPESLVLAGAQELGGYNPVRGYAELGVSPIYEGLLRLSSDGDARLPTLEPALALRAPTPNEALTTWRVAIRPGVSFHDGSTFGPEDVVATYRAILDPASASDVRSSLDMISSVSSSGGQVVFTLKYPYIDFPTRLLIGIAPAEKLTGGKAEDSSLNTRPVGTGPYRLTELTADRAVFEASPTYWGKAPQVRKVTTVFVPDDNTRAQRMSAGEIDGASLPPLLATTFEGRAGVRVDAVRSADWRGVSLPKDNAFAQDPAARMAMNLAVDRTAMVQTVLGGKGSAASTPVSPVYGAAYDPQAVFRHDVAAATRILDEAGWVRGSDGIRVKGGTAARFTVAYRPTDVLRRDLATAFAADMAKIGVDVRLEGLDFATLQPRVDRYGILLGGGDRPYSLDTQLFGALHSQVPGSSPWDNPGGYSTPARDAALVAARRTADPAARTTQYRSVQTEYVKNPAAVYLVFLDHTYVSKDDSTTRGPFVVEPHAHGVDWGPWWNIQSWRW